MVPSTLKINAGELMNFWKNILLFASTFAFCAVSSAAFSFFINGDFSVLLSAIMTSFISVFVLSRIFKSRRRVLIGTNGMVLGMGLMAASRTVGEKGPLELLMLLGFILVILSLGYSIWTFFADGEPREH